MKFKIKVGEKEYEIEVLEKNEETVIRVGEKEFFFEGEKEKKISLGRYFYPEKKTSKEILAPISGIVNEIFVKEGDSVKSGQKLLVLSAMKMENEICSDADGKIKKIFVEKNKAVKKGEKLIEIE